MGEIRDAPVEVVAFRGQAVEEFRGGLAVDDAGRQLGDGLAAQSGGVQLADEVDPVDGGFCVVALAAAAALGGEQVLFLVVPQGPGGDARAAGEFPDPHSRPFPRVLHHAHLPFTSTSSFTVAHVPAGGRMIQLDPVSG